MSLHVRVASIKRTPSDLSKTLAEADLPPPSAVSEAGRATDSALARAELTDRIDKMHFEEPEALTIDHRRRASLRAQSAVSDALSSIDLGIPEAVSRANRRADGAVTPAEANVSRSPQVVPVDLEGDVPATPAAGEAGPAATATATAAAGTDQIITPWDVQGAVVDGKQVAVDYTKLINQFGTRPIDDALLARFEQVTGHKPHLLLRRGTFFSHRELNEILTRYEQKKPFYLYTGRGPSSDSMHLGHMIPFVFTQWLQSVFNVPLVVQLTDDEKFLFKQDLKLDQVHQFSFDNARDIIACGFKLEKTFIFSNLEFFGGPMYWNTLRLAKLITGNQAKQTFGFELGDNIGRWFFPAIEAAPAFCDSFPQIYGTRMDVPCLIPCAIDQDPYFRITRELAPRLKHKKPALIHAKFIPSLQGAQSKMSASVGGNTIFMTDTPKQIKDKINKYAFSGGQTSVEEHRRLGGDPDVDVSYQYLTFFEEDDAKLAQIAADYRSGKLLSGELKALAVNAIQEFVKAFQTRKAAVTDDLVKQFMDPKRPIDPSY